MSGAIPPLQYAFIAWCLVKHRDNLTFTLPLSDRLTYVNVEWETVVSVAT